MAFEPHHMEAKVASACPDSHVEGIMAMVNTHGLA